MKQGYNTKFLMQRSLLWCIIVNGVALSEDVRGIPIF